MAVVVLLVGLSPMARADDVFAGYDLLVNRQISAQDEALAQAAREVADWANGRATAQATGQVVDERLVTVRAALQKLQKITPPRGAVQLHQAVVEVGRSSLKVLESARRFLRAGDPDHKALCRYAARNLRVTAAIRSRWLMARSRILPLALAGSSPMVREYYTWQAAVLPLQRKELALATQVNLMLLNQGTDTLGRARKALHDAVRLRAQADAIRPPNFLLAAHRQFLHEQMALARVCEAGALLAQDPSPDSVSRLHRFSEELAASSWRAEQARIKALAHALGRH